MAHINDVLRQALDISEALDEAGDRKGGDLAQDLASHLFAKIIMTRKRAPGPMMPTATQRVDHAADDLAALADSTCRQRRSWRMIDPERRDAAGMSDAAQRNAGEKMSSVTIRGRCNAVGAAGNLVGAVADAQRAEADPSDPFE